MSHLGKNDPLKKGPLEGIRVVEYGVFHAGPGAGAILGDLGAEVIKIESGEGDPARGWTGVGNLDWTHPNGENVIFHVSNRNKKGVYLDIGKEQGRKAFHKLIKEADVFLTNLRSSTKDKLGLDYGSLSKVNSRIIHANMSAYGEKGPMKDLGGYDPLGMARSGMMYVSGQDKPVLLNLAILDQAAAIAASHAILTALFVRERRGVGQEIHVSLYSSGLWLCYANFTISNVLSIDASIHWDRSLHSPLRNFFRCKDGKWIIGTHHPEQKYWPVFCEATGQDGLIEDPRFADDEARTENCAELVAHFDKVFLKQTRDEWMEIFLKRGLMFCSIQHISEVQKDPQALANDYVVDLEDPLLGQVKVPGYPIHFSENQVGTRRMGPKMGEHTREVLIEMGYTDQEIENLKREGVIL